MPFLSPDGQSVGFFADGKLKKMLLAGGDPLVICDAPNDSPGAAWGPNNRILFTTIWTGGPLVSVSADGGPVTPVSTLDASRNERGHWWPEPLPDGRHVLFTIWFAGAGISDSHVAVLDLQTGRHRSLFPGADARYAAGHLVFFRAGAYQAVRFDPTTQTATSEPKIVLPDAVGIPPAGLSYKRVGLSASGNLGFVVGDTYPEFAVSWLSRDGHIEPTPLKLRHNGFMLSPDGRKLAYGRPQSGLSQIAIYDFASRTEQRLQSPGYNFDPVWHPDGQRVAFVSMRKGDFDIYVEGVGTAHSEALLDTDKDEQPVLWMPGGRSFIAWVWEPDGSNPMVLVDVATKAISPPLVGGRILKGWSAVSEDSRWLWFCARPADTWQLYVRSLSGAGTAQSLGTCRSSDQALFQSARTHEVIVARGTDLVALSYTDRGDRFIVLTERVVARIGATDRVFGISPDGQRFLIGKRTRGDAETAGIRVAINGLEALLNGSTP
jgi:serine/threonine-protein kinase